MLLPVVTATRSAQADSSFGFLKIPAVWMCFAFFFWYAAVLSVIQTFAPSAAQRLHDVPVALVAMCLTIYMLGSAGGMVLGGFLVGPTWLNSALCVWLGAGLQSFGTLAVSLAALLAFYALAAALNRLIPDSGVRYAPSPWHVSAVCARFLADQRALWRDPLGSISLAVTTLFWGVGATLQLLVLAWAQQALHLSLEHAAYLQAATAIGVIAGAALAARLVALEHTPKVLGVGILLGLLLPLMSLVHAWQVAAVLTFVLGLVGGFFVVPMNALLQHRGATLLSAGRSISVQNTNENASVLAMMGMYSALLYAQVDVDQLVWMLGALVALGMGLVQWRYWALKSSQRIVAGQGLGQL